MKIGVGVCCYKRPDYFAEVAEALVKHVDPLVTWIGAAHDAPRSEAGDYRTDLIPVTFLEHRGPAAAKNHLIKEALAAGCDVVALSEDDVVVDSPEAVFGFIEAMGRSGWGHLGFPYHAENEMVDADDVCGYWWTMPGAWTLTTREAIETVGLLDEGFYRCHEHVEWDLRLAEHGFTSGWHRFAAPLDCEPWLHEIPGSRETSTIRTDPHWPVHIAAARKHWLRAHPESARVVFGG